MPWWGPKAGDVGLRMGIHSIYFEAIENWMHGSKGKDMEKLRFDKNGIMGWNICNFAMMAMGSEMFRDNFHFFLPSAQQALMT